MSHKMKSRRRHDRLKRVRHERAEMSLFFGRGRFPSNAVSCAMCRCGARAFTTNPDESLDDFMDMHSGCDA